MADFTNEVWSIYIAIITIVSILACAWLLWTMSGRKVSGSGTETTGHTWDETLGEYNNPLPRWWMWMFYITIVFALVYLVLYPGLGSYAGTLGWSQTKQYEEEIAQSNAIHGPLFAKFTAMPLEQMALDPAARSMGERLFLNYCAQCHGSDARGSKGFPDLTDRDTLWGGTPEAIKTSIAEGRNGVMPPLTAALGSANDVGNVAHYVLSLSGATHDASKATLGKEKFTVCAVCHGAEGKGNPQLGAPDLTDRVWLHGSGIDAIVEVITKGRDNRMPAHKDFLGEAKVHLLAGYVLGLSKERSGSTK
jgi:cytochrome c oxidase cbb3-type subunit III